MKHPSSATQSPGPSTESASQSLMTLQSNYHPGLWHLKPCRLEVQVQDGASCGQLPSAPPWGLSVAARVTSA